MLFRSPISLKKNEALHLNRRIAVVPCSPGAGASFVVSKLVSEESGTKSVVELGNPYFYLSLNLNKRFTAENFTFYEDVINRKGLREIRNNYSDINWLLRKPMNREPLPERTILKACEFPPEGTVFYDFSGVFGDTLFSVLPEMDAVYLVVDPLPSRLIEWSLHIEKLRLICPEAGIIVNKMNKGVFKKELDKFLETSDYTEISFVNPELVYKAEYNCTLPQYFV